MASVEKPCQTKDKEATDTADNASNDRAGVAAARVVSITSRSRGARIIRDSYTGVSLRTVNKQGAAHLCQKTAIPQWENPMCQDKVHWLRCTA